jgi:hypothetical protein
MIPSEEFGISRVAATSSLMWMPHARQRGNAHCPLIPICLPLDADSVRSARQATPGENGERSSAHGLSLGPLHTRQWIGTYAGRGNGDYQGELASALRAITSYLAFFALTAQVALVRLDGQYGDAVAIAQLIGAGVHLVTRERRVSRPGAPSDPTCARSPANREGDQSE